MQDHYWIVECYIAGGWAIKDWGYTRENARNRAKKMKGRTRVRKFVAAE